MPDAPSQPNAPNEEAFLLGEEEAYKLYLSEKVRRKEMTAEQADKAMDNYKRRGMVKLLASPLHDGREVGVTLKEIAQEMGTWWPKVYFKTYGKSQQIILKGHPALRETLKGTRYKITNPRFMTWQIASQDMVSAARKSTRFGLWVACAADVVEFVFRDNETYGQLFGHLAYDIPTVVIASVAGVAAQAAFVAGAAALGITVIASGPLIIGFAVAAGVGLAFGWADDKYHISERLGAAFDEAIANFEAALDDLQRRLSRDVDEVMRDLARAKAVFDLLYEADELWRDLARKWPQVPRWRYVTM